jgi:multiple sugar transport system ATP-binding protein
VLAELVLERLTRSFPGRHGELIHAVRGISLRVASGELLVLVGPSGSGKTTILRLIAGLEEPTQGMISIEGRPMIGVPPDDREVAMVFQDHPLFPHMTVAANLGFGLRLRHTPQEQIRQRVREVSALLGMGALLDRLPAQISGGERQRVALGRALVRQPKVFLLDEPLSNLDPPLRTELRVAIKQLQRRLSITMIYVTHDQAEAMALADRMLVLHEGRAEQVGSPLELHRAPVNIFVARFLGSPGINLVRGRVEQRSDETWFVAEAGSTEAPLQLRLRARVARAGEAVLGVRPEDLTLAASPIERALPGRIELAEPLGGETWLHIRAGGGHPLIVRVTDSANYHVGDTVR